MRRRNCGIKVKSLIWKRNCKTSSHTKFIVWKRNCVTSKPQYFLCSEAELLHFRAPIQILFCMRKRNCGTLSLSIFLVRRRNFKPKNISCMEAELQNFKSHNSLCAEAELQVTYYSVCGISLVSYARIRSARERKAEGPCFKAILAVLFSTVPSWRWSLLGLF